MLILQDKDAIINNLHKRMFLKKAKSRGFLKHKTYRIQGYWIWIYARKILSEKRLLIYISQIKHTFCLYNYHF